MYEEHAPHKNVADFWSACQVYLHAITHFNVQKDLELSPRWALSPIRVLWQFHSSFARKMNKYSYETETQKRQHSHPTTLTHNPYQTYSLTARKIILRYARPWIYSFQPRSRNDSKNKERGNECNGWQALPLGLFSARVIRNGSDEGRNCRVELLRTKFLCTVNITVMKMTTHSTDSLAHKGHKQGKNWKRNLFPSHCFRKFSQILCRFITFSSSP